jgi:hypothetical protein
MFFLPLKNKNSFDRQLYFLNKKNWVKIKNKEEKKKRMNDFMVI